MRAPPRDHARPSAKLEERVHRGPHPGLGVPGTPHTHNATGPARGAEWGGQSGHGQTMGAPGPAQAPLPGQTSKRGAGARLGTSGVDAEAHARPGLGAGGLGGGGGVFPLLAALWHLGSRLDAGCGAEAAGAPPPPGSVPNPSRATCRGSAPRRDPACCGARAGTMRPDPAWPQTPPVSGPPPRSWPGSHPGAPPAHHEEPPAAPRAACTRPRAPRCNHGGGSAGNRAGPAPHKGILLAAPPPRARPSTLRPTIPAARPPPGDGSPDPGHRVARPGRLTGSCSCCWGPRP